MWSQETQRHEHELSPHFRVTVAYNLLETTHQCAAFRMCSDVDTLLFNTTARGGYYDSNNNTVTVCRTTLLQQEIPEMGG